MNKISKIFCTLFYIGNYKWAPGTIASLISLLIISLLNIFINEFIFIILYFFLIFISIKLINVYTAKLEEKDCKEIVIDEFLGIYFILIFSNNYIVINIYLKLLFIFIFFRIFDILKPFPINLIDKKLNNSYGVILDDIIAGIYTLIILFLINEFI